MIGPSSEVRTIPARARQRCALGWVSYHGYSEPGLEMKLPRPDPTTSRVATGAEQLQRD